MRKNLNTSSKQFSRLVLVIAVAIFFLLPGVLPVAIVQKNVQAQSSPSVVINEIAWAGTAANSSHEWIELRNLSSSSVDLTGWIIQNDQNTFVIPLDTGVIPGNGYFLIERVEDSTSIQSDLLFPDLSLSESGDSLELRDDSDVLMDTANNNGGAWPAGYSYRPVCSMERTNNAGMVVETDDIWSSALQIANGPQDENGEVVCGSPKSLNSAIPMTATLQSSITPSPTATDTPISYPVRSIVINEVAWMGNLLLVNHEWIEIYNPTNNVIPLYGWTIRSTSSSFRVNLTGEIGSGKFFIVGATANTFQNKPLDQVVVDWIPLKDQGDSLVLYDPSGNLIDTANKNAEKWPAGNQTTACTMVRGAVNAPDLLGSWLTFAGTRSTYKDANGVSICGSPWTNTWGYSVTPTRTATPTLTPMKTATPTTTPTGYRPASVILNEFLVRPTQDYNKDGEINSGDAFIEIVNVGKESVSLSGWRIDDQPLDSTPYYIKDVRIDGYGGKVVFFAKETGIILSVGTDSVRLFKPDSSLNDAKTYTVDPNRGESWCRHPDGYGDWNTGCFPSPGLDNSFGMNSSGDKDLECDHYDLFDLTARQNCVKVYEWSFDFTEPLFEDPSEVWIGTYRLLIK